MQVGLVLGRATSTVKHHTLNNQKLLIVQPLMSDQKRPDGGPVLVIDCLGSGIGDTVMMTSDGSALKEMFGIENSPVRWAVLGIVDPTSG
jgi:ethanolamine utilization protein EutN